MLNAKCEKKTMSKAELTASTMPPLYHVLPGQSFDVKKSQVLKWLIEKPEVLNYLLCKIKERAIVYDGSTGLWRGVNHHE